MKLYQQLADNLTALAEILKKHPVRACWFMTSFQNPLGALVPDQARKELVRLLEAYEVPLIEDDVYAELYFGMRRPTAIVRSAEGHAYA